MWREHPVLGFMLRRERSNGYGVDLTCPPEAGLTYRFEFEFEFEFGFELTP